MILIKTDSHTAKFTYQQECLKHYRWFLPFLVRFHSIYNLWQPFKAHSCQTWISYCGQIALYKPKKVSFCNNCCKVAQIFNFLARVRIQPSTIWSSGFRQWHSLYNRKYHVKLPGVLIDFWKCQIRLICKSSLWRLCFCSSDNDDQEQL